MLTVYYLTAALFAAAVTGVGVLLHFKASAKLNIFFKTVSLVLATVLFFRYMTDYDNLQYIINLEVTRGFETKSMVALALVQVWFAYAAELLVILAPFFKVKAMPAWVGFVGTAIFVLNFIMLNNHILAIAGADAVNAFRYRAFLLAIETGLGLGYCVVYLVMHVKQAISLRKWEWFWFALGAVAMICCSIPSYAFQYVMDPTRFAMVAKGFNLYHRLFLYPAVIIPIVLYVLLKDRPFETRYFAMMFYAWAGLINFSVFHRFEDFFGPGWVTALPLHLCNTAMYITPLCLTFKWKKFFYFTYFINVLGALFALLMPNYSSTSGILLRSVWLFYMNHYQAFFMPLLVVGLGIFRRPRWKEFKYSMVAFSIYFVLMLVANAWFSNYNPKVDYFFLNGDFIVDKLGEGAKSTRNIVWEFTIKDLHFKFYPLYQSLFLIVYYALAFAVWFVYELAYSVVMGWLDIDARNKKIKLDKIALEVKLAGRSIEEPMNMENTNKLILKNFTKRYGTSDVYAVKDANLEVCGGQIYGFLGPNGAGKSTIIKSIVGIQTITDGAIEVCGYDVSTQPVQAKRQIGFVPDHYALYERLTAREYINYIADLYEVSAEDREARINKYVQLFDFASAIDNPIKTYSHGMKQKVTIMSALIHNPKVWILDEPLTGLDPTSIFQVKECMKQHAREGNIVFFSSHIIDVVERICDQIAIICKGQIQCTRNVHEMEAAGESLEHFYMQTISKAVQPVAVEKTDGNTPKPEDDKPKFRFGKGKKQAAKAPTDTKE